MDSDSQSCSPILSDREPLLLEQRELWPAEEGWLTFDLTATSNLWLDSPEQNLGLHLVLEDSRGQTFTPRHTYAHACMHAHTQPGKMKRTTKHQVNESKRF